MKIVLLLVFSTISSFGLAYASGPIVPTGNNTVTQYCLNGICSTSHTLPWNATIGLNQPGMYTHGISQRLSPLIGIQDTQVCLKLIKANSSNHCLTYDKLKSLDNTNPAFAGQWVQQPYYHRLAPKVLNHYNFNPNKFIVMVDPDPDFTARARMIYVTDKNFTWVNPNDVSTNNMIKIYVNRSISDCSIATVAPIPSLVNDTLHYMESGCTKTSYNDTQIGYMKQIPFDFANCTQCHYQTWLSQAKQITQNCITQKCTPLKDPNSRW